MLHDFVRVFTLGRGGPVKRTSQSVHKRLRDNESATQDYKKGGVGRPLKIARVADLQQVYPELS